MSHIGSVQFISLFKSVKMIWTIKLKGLVCSGIRNASVNINLNGLIVMEVDSDAIILWSFPAVSAMRSSASAFGFAVSTPYPKTFDMPLRILLNLWFVLINSLCVGFQFDATLDVLSSIIVLWRYSNAAAVHSAHREYMWVRRPYWCLKVFEVDFVSLLVRELRIEAKFACI